MSGPRASRLAPRSEVRVEQGPGSTLPGPREVLGLRLGDDGTLDLATILSRLQHSTVAHAKAVASFPDRRSDDAERREACE